MICYPLCLCFPDFLHQSLHFISVSLLCSHSQLKDDHKFLSFQTSLFLCLVLLPSFFVLKVFKYLSNANSELLWCRRLDMWFVQVFVPLSLRTMSAICLFYILLLGFQILASWVLNCAIREFSTWFALVIGCFRLKVILLIFLVMLAFLF